MAKKKTTSKRTTNLRPLDDRVIVKPQEAEEKTASGIYLPETAKEKPMTGEIVAVGPGKLNNDGSRAEISVSPGDTVLYGKYGGTEITLDGETFMIMREGELLGVIEK
ncbi:MAG: co-chaperone GroES [Phycisphaeraceae bacterium]